MKMETEPKAGGVLAALLYLLLVAVALATGSCAREARGRDAGVAFESTVLISTACIETANGTQHAYKGTGVIIDKTTVLTAAHVAEDDPGFVCLRVATMVNGKSFMLTPGVVLHDRDLATLKTMLLEFDPTYTVVYGEAPGFGGTVCAMTAYPRWLWRCGLVQTTAEPPGDLSHTIVVEPGNSGSGVYDTSGRLVGVITHRWSCMNGQLCGGKMATLEGWRDALKL